MIDIHSHILFDIDDGPEDIEASMKMCFTAAEYGVERIVATPHLTRIDKLDRLAEKRSRRLESIGHQIRERNLGIRIYSGAEVLINDDIFYAGDLSKATINGSRYMLVEFDFFSLSSNRLIKYIDEIFKLGYIPIIAHPERYKYLQRDYGLVNYISDRGAFFQINAGSLASLGNREEFELAYQMVLNNVASFIATDSHSHHGRANDLLRLVRFFPPDIKKESLDYMLYEAPQAVLENRDMPSIRRHRVAKRRIL